MRFLSHRHGWGISTPLGVVDSRSLAADLPDTLLGFIERAEHEPGLSAHVAALAAAAPVVRAVHDALVTARPLPRERDTPLLFDDLSPAVAAVVAGDATAAEALAGVLGGWTRIEAPAVTP